MGWLPDGCATCDTCGKLRIGPHEREQAIQMMRAAGWHHWVGVTLGGVGQEVILCPQCAKDEKKRPRSTVIIEQDSLFEWKELQDFGKSQGIQSR